MATLLASTRLTVWPSGAAPQPSDLTSVAGAVVSNLVVATLGPGSTVELQSSSAIMGTVDGVDGVDGWYRSAGPAARSAAARPSARLGPGAPAVH